ncbi:MAG: GNAT family N-acetyltransferase [Candidatus Hodarchaeota archaeon]
MSKQMVLEGLRCRGARADEAMVIGRIIDGAFKHEKRTGHLLVKNFDKLEDIRVAYRVQDGVEELLGVCPIRHYPCHFGPTTLKAGGLSMVGVLPKYQKKGIGQFLLGCAEKYLSKEGFDVGLLFSGSPTFYQHQNWEVAVDHYFHTINAGSIPLDLDELGGLSLEARKLRESDFPAINELYENFNKDRVLTKVRDQAWWDKHHQRYTQESNPYYCFFNHSSLVAYVRVHPRVTGFTGAYLGKKTNDAYLTEYAIEPSIPVKEQRSIVEYLLAWLKDFAMQRVISLISTPLPDAYPLV